MLALKYQKRWQLAGGLLLLFVLLSAIMPALWFWDDRVKLVSWLGHIDKWFHVLTFAFLTTWFSGQFSSKNYWRIALALVAFGILIELCQRLVGYRYAEWSDVIANVIGIAAGLGLATAGLGGRSQKVENWIERRQAAR